MPRILLLSTTTGYQLRSFGEAADELGIELTFATDRCLTLDDPWRDSAVPVRFHEETSSVDAVVAAARERAIDGVIAVGDRPVVLAARVASALGLPGHPPDAARASAHKRLTRERFARAGLAVPWCLPLRLDDDPDRAGHAARYPAVVKPVGLSGSRGVIRVNDGVELAEALRRLSALLSRPDIRAQRTGTEQDLLLEGFIPGREYAIEGLLTRGRFRALALFDKPDPLDGPYFEETIYVTPSAAAPALERDILSGVERAAHALGLWHGPIHAECRVNEDGVFVLEVAARPIGGLCSRVLRFEESQQPEAGPGSLEHVLLRHAIGADVSGLRREARAAAVMMIPIPRRGVYRSVRGEDRARGVPYVEDVRVTAKPDQLIEPLPEAGSYLGFIFARAPHAAEAEAAVRAAHGQLTFAIDTPIPVRS
jgi:biotin carboxylase